MTTPQDISIVECAEQAAASAALAQPALVIDPEFHGLLQPLRPEELAELEADILTDGCTDALKVWREDGRDILIDGHHRHAICLKHNLPFKTEPIELPSRDHVRLWIEKRQLGRRNLTEDQRAELVVSIAERRSQIAKTEQRRQAGKASGAARRGELNGSVDVLRPVQSPKRDTRAETARELDVSETSMRKITHIGKVDPELRAKIRRGEMPIRTAMHLVRQIENKAHLESIEAMEAKALKGLFDVIVADPPWPVAGSGAGGWPVKYPLMSLEDIERDVGSMLAAHANEDCQLFLWITQPFLREGFRLVEAWRFQHVLTFTWMKDGGPKPIGLPRYNSEFVLYARRGKPKFIDTKNFDACFTAPRRKHSEKPEAFYAILRRVTAGRRLDMFNRRLIDGFVGWGKEAPTAEDAAA